jgi:hypothetical protein
MFTRPIWLTSEIRSRDSKRQPCRCKSTTDKPVVPYRLVFVDMIPLFTFSSIVKNIFSNRVQRYISYY